MFVETLTSVGLARGFKAKGIQFVNEWMPVNESEIF